VLVWVVSVVGAVLPGDLPLKQPLKDVRIWGYRE